MYIKYIILSTVTKPTVVTTKNIIKCVCNVMSVITNQYNMLYTLHIKSKLPDSQPSVRYTDIYLYTELADDTKLSLKISESKTH